MKKILLLFAICIVSVSLAQEFPVIQTDPVFFNFDPSQFDRETVNTPLSNLPAWAVLENMDLSERQNSLIDIEYVDGNTSVEIFNQISALWNDGNYEEALSLFKSLDEGELKGVGIGISWKTPIPTNDQTDWGTDVRIGNRDSIEAVSLAHDKTTGHLFAALSFMESGNYYYSINLSTNQGLTWSETFLFSISSPPNKLITFSSTTVGSHFYFGHTFILTKNVGRLRRFNTSDGIAANFPDGSTFITVFSLASTDSVKEIVVASNQSYQNNRLYYAAITKSDSIKIFWNIPTGVVYNEYVNTFVDAEEGLDLCWNNDLSFSTSKYYLFGSYITKSKSIKIFGVTSSSDSLKQLTSLFAGMAKDYSSVSAQHDTITAVFSYYAGVNEHNRYIVSYNGGSTWLWGVTGDSTTTSEAPDIAAGNGGVGIIYRYYTPTREGRFVWRPLFGTWSTPVKYTDHEPYYNKPAIEYLGNKKFGVVYLSWNSPVRRGAYFDMNNMAVGIDDELVENPSIYDLSQNYPNPFNPSTLIRYQIPVQSNVSIKVYDALGNLVKELVNQEQSAGIHQVEFNADKFASGIYFYRIQAGSFVQTKKMMLVR